MIPLFGSPTGVAGCPAVASWLCVPTFRWVCRYRRSRRAAGVTGSVRFPIVDGYRDRLYIKQNPFPTRAMPLMIRYVSQWQ